ncbi:hypothetical protein ACJX0J_013409 [Zea mays]
MTVYMFYVLFIFFICHPTKKIREQRSQCDACVKVITETAVRSIDVRMTMILSKQKKSEFQQYILFHSIWHLSMSQGESSRRLSTIGQCYFFLADKMDYVMPTQRTSTQICSILPH